MSTQPYLFAIVAFAILNGIFSPITPYVAVGALLPLSPVFFATSMPVLLFAASLLVSTLTIMLAGVPAALWERISGAEESTGVSMWIWLAGTAVLTLPAVLTFLAVGR